MKLEFCPLSFVIGCAVGAGAVLLAPRLKPVVLELLTGVFKLWDAAVEQAQARREDLEDLVAEARAQAAAARRAGRPRPAPAAPSA